MAKEVPWDDQTDAFLSDLSPAMTKKYGINLRTLLTNPKSYEDKKDMPTTIKKIRADVDDYFTALLAELKDKQKDLDEELGELTDQSKQVSSVIASKSAVARVPFVKPMYVDSNPDSQETIVIEKYDSSLDSFIGKLVNGSNYVADMSTEYKDHKLGSWLFSGAKNYILTINTPPNPILTIENSRALVENTLDALSGG